MQEDVFAAFELIGIGFSSGSWRIDCSSSDFCADGDLRGDLNRALMEAAEIKIKLDFFFH